MGEGLERGDLVATNVAGGGSFLRRARRRISAPFWRHGWLRTVAELAPPVAWMTLIYIAALAALFVYAFWTVDSFTGKVVHTWSFDNFREIFRSGPFRRVIWRTVGISAAVTVTCAVLAFPFAYFMARVATPRMRAMLFVLVLLPLWSSYLVRVYAWKVILANDGILNWSMEKIGLPAANIGYTNTAMWLVFTYIWLPFMILPVYAALERIPHSYIEASRDLGASGFTTLRRVILPLALPGDRRRLDFHLLPDARRLHHADARRRRRLDLHRQHRLLDRARGLREPAVRGGVRRGAARRDGDLPGAREADGRVRGLVVERTGDAHRRSGSGRSASSCSCTSRS